MNTNNYFDRFIVFLTIFVVPCISCDDKDQFDFNRHNRVAVLTQQAVDITKNEAALSGRVNTNNGEALTQIGICYSTQSKPTVSNDKELKTEGVDTGDFTLYLQNLKPSTTYYFRAFATNKSGTAYGESLNFTTESGYVSKLETQAPTNVTRTSAAIVGQITDDGGYKLTAKGFCYSSTTAIPTIFHDKVSLDMQSDAFSASITKLTAGTRYYVRAYASSEVGIGYGPVISFTTAAPIVASGITTTTASAVSISSALVGGHILEDNGSPVSARGICYSLANNLPTISNGTILNIGSGTGSFSGSLTGLLANTTYYVRAFATNAAGTVYGSVVTVKTLLPDLPSSVSTQHPSSVSMTIAQAGGYVGNAGGGIISARGIVYSANNSSPSLGSGTVVAGGSGTGTFSVTLSGLQYNTTYYVRCYATNQAGTTYGNTVSFRTSLPSLPSNLSTYSASNVSQNSAYLSAYVGSAGGGMIAVRGIVYSSSTSSPTVGASLAITSGTGTGAFGATVSGLSAGTTYYARAFATNEAGTAYGNLISFTTVSSYAAPIRVSTYQVSGLGGASATFSGHVEANGGSAITERGFVYSMSYSSPTLSTGSKAVATGSSVGSFSRYVSGLSRYTTYYVRAYATNAYGTTYGTATSFYAY